jgi:putative inorganic carbon (hco3(-)) transporter
MSYAARVSAPSNDRGSTAATVVAPLVISALVTWLVYTYEAPVGLAAILGGGALLFLLARPAVATVMAVFLLYANIPAVLSLVHGVPRPVAGSLILLLAIPLLDHLVLRRARLRADEPLALMLCFLAVLLLSTLGAKDKAFALEEVMEYVAEGVVLYWLLLNVVRDVQAIRRVVWAALFAGGLLATMNIYQWATGDYARDFWGLAARQLQHLEANQERALQSGVRAGKLYLADRAAGPQMDSNYVAQIMIVLVPLAWLRVRNSRKRARLVALGIGGAILVGGVFLTYSRGALLTLMTVVAVATYLRWLPRRQVMLAALCALPLLPAVAPVAYRRLASLKSVTSLNDPNVDVSLRGRATEMLAAAHVVMDYPVLGVGPGQYKPFYSVQYQQTSGIKFRDLQHVRRAHNLYLELAAETGLVGLALFLAVPLLLLRGLWGAYRRVVAHDRELADTAMALLLGIVGFLVAGMFLTLAYQRYFWFLLALAGATLQIIRRTGIPKAPDGGVP